jgi:hypothetical protein
VHDKKGEKELYTRKSDTKLQGLFTAAVYGDAYECKVYISRRDVPNKVGYEPKKKSQKYH